MGGGISEVFLGGGGGGGDIPGLPPPLYETLGLIATFSGMCVCVRCVCVKACNGLILFLVCVCVCVCACESL